MELNRNPLLAYAASANGTATPEQKPRRCRSAVSNGKRLFVIRPGDSAWTRRFSDIFAEVVSDLGGRSMLSEGQKQLARRAATLSIFCEKAENDAALGKEIDVDLYGTMCDRLGRCFQRLGLERRARDVTPTLADIIKEAAAGREAATRQATATDIDADGDAE
jgi:hypothetical protein